MKNIIDSESGTAVAFSSLLHSIILFAILSALYLIVILKLSQTLFNREIEGIIQNNLPDSLDNLDKDKKFRSSLQALPFKKLAEKYDKPSEAIELNNKWVTIVMYMIGGGLVLLFIVSALFLYFSADHVIPLKDIILENIVVFMFVGGFELLFFIYVASNYIPVKPSLIMSTFHSSIKDTIDSW
jgi:hypothetical protein